jgi:hypothetical protein
MARPFTVYTFQPHREADDEKEAVRLFRRLRPGSDRRKRLLWFLQVAAEAEDEERKRNGVGR